MTGVSRGLVLTLVLTVLAAIGGAWIGGRYVYDQRHQPSLHEFVHNAGVRIMPHGRDQRLARSLPATRRSA